MPYGYNVDQTNIPQVGSPIDSAISGVSQGMAMGLGLQRARQDAKTNQLQQQAAMQEIKRKQMDTFVGAAEKLTTTKNPILRDIYYQKIIRPIGAEMFGTEFPEKYDDKMENYYSALVEAKKNSKTPEEFDLQTIEIISRAKNSQEDTDDLFKAAERLSPKKNELSPQQQFNQQKSVEDRTAEFRNRLVTSEPYKNFSDITGKASTIEKMVVDPGAFGDLGILFDYMKALDPTSVVREGEQERFKATGSLSTRGANALNALVTGKTLTQEQREEVLKYTKMRQKTAFDIYQTHAKPTIEQAKRLNLNLSEIDPYFGQKFESPNPAGSSNATSIKFNSIEEAESANLPIGTIIEIGGRKARVE